MMEPRKVLLTLLVLGATGSLVAFSAFSAFSSTSSNPNNSFAAGTVNIADNDAGAALYSVSNQKPLVTTDKCIKVTYTGSLDSDVKLYTASALGSLAPYVNLTITPGTQAVSTFPDCTGFVADGAALFSGTLSSFATAHNSYANGLVDNPGAVATKWVTNDAVVYKFSLTLQDDNAANGGASPLSTGTHAFTWEARNQ
jgi:hypothetical protein